MDGQDGWMDGQDRFITTKKNEILKTLKHKFVRRHQHINFYNTKSVLELLCTFPMDGWMHACMDGCMHRGAAEKKSGLRVSPSHSLLPGS